MTRYATIIWAFVLLCSCQTQDQTTMNSSAKPNYTESKVSEFELPALIQPEETDSSWIASVRPKVFKMLEEKMFGKIPEEDIQLEFRVVKEVQDALDGLAKLKEVEMSFSKNGKVVTASLLILTPADIEEKVPIFLGMNFYGNHTIHPSKDISISKSWVGNNADFQIEDNQADERSRGVRAHRWPIELILGQGYGLANIYYGDIDPDFDDDFQNGIHQLFNAKPVGDQWGSIATWSWALSKAMDYLESDDLIDPKRIAVIGHSRLGKTALWAGAIDPRFALVISNNSGCGGAALSKRKFGETLKAINTRFPHWFCKAFHEYSDREEHLPYDQHFLLALIAPRPLYVASATQDEWADPKGEYLGIAYAGKVYELYGEESLDPTQSPKPDMPIIKGKTGYHLRTGKHDLTEYDWKEYLAFADNQLGMSN